MPAVPTAPRERRYRSAPRPPRSMWRRSIPYLIVYGVPLLGFAILEYMSWARYDERFSPPRLEGRWHIALLAPLKEGFRDWWDAMGVLLLLLLIASFAIKRHPLTAVVSFFALAWYLLMGLFTVSG